eukprot:2904260-Rhodomonas_salina.2
MRTLTTVPVVLVLPLGLLRLEHGVERGRQRAHERQRLHLDLGARQIPQRLVPNAPLQTQHHPLLERQHVRAPCLLLRHHKRHRLGVLQRHAVCCEPQRRHHRCQRPPLVRRRLEPDLEQVERVDGVPRQHVPALLGARLQQLQQRRRQPRLHQLLAVHPCANPHMLRQRQSPPC